MFKNFRCYKYKFNNKFIINTKYNLNQKVFFILFSTGIISYTLGYKLGNLITKYQIIKKN